MRTTLITCLVGFATLACSAAPASRPVTATLPAAAVRHVVVFRYKPDASAEKIRQGFTHVYQLTFMNAATRDVYLVHPGHKAFGTLLGGSGVFDAAFVVD